MDAVLIGSELKEFAAVEDEEESVVEGMLNAVVVLEVAALVGCLVGLDVCRGCAARAHGCPGWCGWERAGWWGETSETEAVARRAARFTSLAAKLVVAAARVDGWEDDGVGVQGWEEEEDGIGGWEEDDEEVEPLLDTLLCWTVVELERLMLELVWRVECSWFLL